MMKSNTLCRDLFSSGVRVTYRTVDKDNFPLMETPVGPFFGDLSVRIATFRPKSLQFHCIFSSTGTVSPLDKYHSPMKVPLQYNHSKSDLILGIRILIPNPVRKVPQRISCNACSGISTHGAADTTGKSAHSDQPYQSHLHPRKACIDEAFAMGRRHELRSVVADLLVFSRYCH
ncbi:hypothetical protein M501DRAFT_53311 [Patellaria atrata CBS 101060]|uniref:Uncharacterized protein n=1 Tax=Patellaria atrata CBS 101060 TaxID=1346257 RepID=A0A9P4SI94_9PEZI|nr:hypothetical protein M501DRAFT_53311 [Patellaria atrata CBS 101060]